MLNTIEDNKHILCFTRVTFFYRNQYIYKLILFLPILGAVIHCYIYKAPLHTLLPYFVFFLIILINILIQQQKQTTILNIKLLSLLQKNGDIIFWVNNELDIISCYSNKKSLYHLVNQSKDLKGNKLRTEIIKKISSSFSRAENVYISENDIWYEVIILTSCGGKHCVCFHMVN